MTVQHQETQEAPQAPIPPSFWGLVADIQDKLAKAFGVQPADREATVNAILVRVPGDATGRRRHRALG